MIYAIGATFCEGNCYKVMNQIHLVMNDRVAFVTRFHMIRMDTIVAPETMLEQLKHVIRAPTKHI